ncbi:MAG TPA: hypothetical protein VNA28_05115 [Solirubrobacteraceae bacterium]|nr:hypothetical protein [Solirubrobacteraceae bacterium]
MTDRVPDESTVRTLVKRLGADVIDQITMAVIARATAAGAGAERRFVVRAARIDSTVVESDIRYPTYLGWPRTPRGCLRARLRRPPKWSFAWTYEGKPIKA